MNKHNRVVGQCLAEAESSAAVIAVTRTYEDGIGEHGETVTPDRARWLMVEDNAIFMKRLRQHYKVRAVHAGEYGKQTARAHWHDLLFFQWGELDQSRWLSDAVSGLKEFEAHFRSEWQNHVPKHVMLPVPKADFQRLQQDPEVLLLTLAQKKRFPAVRQKSRYWPFGLVQAELVKAPGQSNELGANRTIRYVIKYLTKDVWKDTALRSLPFDQLPEHVKEATDYGPWSEGEDGHEKWHRRNSYRKALETKLLEEFDSDDDIPIERRIRRPKHMTKARGGLGSLYFKSLGMWYAAQAPTVPNAHELLHRRYSLGVNFRKDQRQSVVKAIEQGRLPEGVKSKFEFRLTDTNLMAFADGFNAQWAREGNELFLGKEYLWDNIETRKRRASDMASGPLGFSLWQKASKTRREQLVEEWSHLDDEILKATVPNRMIALFEETSSVGLWPQRRQKRLLEALEGVPRRSWRVDDRARLVWTDQRKLIYVKTLANGDMWWRREVETVEQFEHALAGVLLPAGAKGARMEKEGGGDQTPLASLDPRTVRNRIEKRLLEPIRDPVRAADGVLIVEDGDVPF